MGWELAGVKGRVDGSFVFGPLRVFNEWCQVLLRVVRCIARFSEAIDFWKIWENSKDFM